MFDEDVLADVKINLVNVPVDIDRQIISGMRMPLVASATQGTLQGILMQAMVRGLTRGRAGPVMSRNRERVINRSIIRRNLEIDRIRNNNRILRNRGAHLDPGGENVYKPTLQRGPTNIRPLVPNDPNRQFNERIEPRRHVFGSHVRKFREEIVQTRRRIRAESVNQETTSTGIRRQEPITSGNIRSPMGLVKTIPEGGFRQSDLMANQKLSEGYTKQLLENLKSKGLLQEQQTQSAGAGATTRRINPSDAGTNVRFREGK